MNQPVTVAFLERNGRFYKFADADTRGNADIQWFAARGCERFPGLGMPHILTLGRMWHLEKTLGVEYDKAPLHAQQTADIVAALYERRCHPLSSSEEGGACSKTA